MYSLLFKVVDPVAFILKQWKSMFYSRGILTRPAEREMEGDGESRSLHLIQV